MINSIEKEILFDILNNPNDSFYENVLSDFLDEQGVEHDFRKPLHKERIEELKPYQEKCLDIWTKYWISIGLCTRPTDEKKAEKYFSDLYKELDFSTPKSIIWFDNPIEMCSQLSNWNRVVNQVWDQINDQVSYQVRDQVCRHVWNQVSNQVSYHVWHKVRDQVSNQVSYHVWHKVRDQVWDHAWNQVRVVKSSVWCRLLHGQQDAHLFAYYSCMMQVLRVEAPKQLLPYMLLAQEINWWFPTEETVYATRKPKECIIEDGKLVKLIYQDGYTIT